MSGRAPVSHPDYLIIQENLARCFYNTAQFFSSHIGAVSLPHALELSHTLHECWGSFVSNISHGDAAINDTIFFYSTISNLTECLRIIKYLYKNSLDLDKDGDLDEPRESVRVISYAIVELILSHMYAEVYSRLLPRVNNLMQSNVVPVFSRKRGSDDPVSTRSFENLLGCLLVELNEITELSKLHKTPEPHADDPICSILVFARVLHARYSQLQVQRSDLDPEERGKKCTAICTTLSKELKELKLNQYSLFLVKGHESDNLRVALAKNFYGPILIKRKINPAEISWERVGYRLAQNPENPRRHTLDLTVVEENALISPENLHALRFRDCADLLLFELMSMIEAVETEQELDDIANALVIFKKCLDFNEGHPIHEYLTRLHADMNSKKQELQEKPREDAQRMAALVLAEEDEENRKAMARRLGRKSRKLKQKTAEIEEQESEGEKFFQKNLSEPADHSLSAAEVFYGEFKKNKSKSNTEKLKLLDEFLSANTAALSNDIVAQIFLQIERAEILLVLNPKDFASLTSQIEVLKTLCRFHIHEEWLSAAIKALETTSKPIIAAAGLQVTHTETKPKEIHPLHIPEDIVKILTALSRRFDSGFTGQTFVVGGWVRDSILRGEKPNDIDLVGIGYQTDLHSSDQFQRELELYLAAGFPGVAIKVQNSKLTNLLLITIGPKNYELWFSAAQTPEEDALKRDFTCGALYTGSDGKVFSPLAGALNDCLKRVCVPANPTEFFQDPVRLLRTLDYFVLRRYELDSKFKAGFLSHLEKLNQGTIEALNDFLGTHRNHFVIRLKKLLSAATKSEQREMLCHYLKPVFFCLLTEDEQMKVIRMGEEYSTAVSAARALSGASQLSTSQFRLVISSAKETIFAAKGSTSAKLVKAQRTLPTP